jgi:hypothetical protein
VSAATYRRTWLAAAGGSAKLAEAFVAVVSAAAAQVRRFNPLHRSHLGRMNNGTHRKLLIVDVRSAFTSGTGIAPAWAGVAARCCPTAGPRRKTTTAIADAVCCPGCDALPILMPPRPVEEGLAMSIVALAVVMLTMLASLAVAAVSWQAMAGEGDVPHSRAGFGGLQFDE